VQIGQAKAAPTKAFFVRMLTRDISLDDCILDLVDNSIDGAKERTGSPTAVLAQGEQLADFVVNIEISHDRFVITDNCGGITFNDAAEYAFTFGRDSTEYDDYSVGVYGIGMKRAVFKLGRTVRIRSTYPREDGELTAFQVPIDVDAWLQASGSWDFNIDEVEPAPVPGVEITVTDLYEEIASKLDDPTYARSLSRILSRDYLLPLNQGLRILVNSNPVEAIRLDLRASESFQPIRYKYEDASVTVEIIAGMNGAPPDDAEPEDPRRPDETSGWYIACNGRVVLAADRSDLTGWGLNSLPKWHSQFRGFVGFALFGAANAALLPMTTTKRSVDPSSATYRRAVARMAQPTRAWVDYTNARKQAGPDDRKAIAALEATSKPIPITSVASRSEVVLPAVPRAIATPVANVSYAVQRQTLRKLAAGFGDPNMSYRDVGISSFDYAYESLVEEED
jgi:hypothetical protein